MRIVYPYNEILPKRKAHDVYIFQECAALANLGWDTTLLIGKGSQRDFLFHHYNVPPDNPLHLSFLYHIRKNNPLRISWNLPFLLQTQIYLRKKKPDWVFLSIRKQGLYHLRRKISGIRYLYEVHELAYYPNGSQNEALFLEKEILSQADLISVTTGALKEILLHPPYSLKVPIEVIPLAVNATSLPPPPPRKKELQLLYVGQLYKEQGISFLLHAVAKVPHVHLKIIGGKKGEIAHLAQLAEQLAIASRVEFLGFLPPYEISKAAVDSHAFVAPFENRERMPYVAHTKLLEYAEWGRPLIAPNLPIVTELFNQKGGVLLFEPDSIPSLASCIEALCQEPLRLKLQQEIATYSGEFSWQKRAHDYAAILT
jgi:glycosyltransferase involved in cell wall biosynthesis